jgi:1-acyl-sn-glycerol-3-phosphate acyltransferase
MLKNLAKYTFMVQLGYKYINIFKKTFFHPFISLKPAYKQLSVDRQNYSNSVLKYLNIEVNIIGELPKEDKILYAINHRSLLDIMVMEHIFAQYDKSGTWIAKQELFDALYGKFFLYSGCMSVDLNNKRGLLTFFKSMKKTLSKVNNLNIYIFPEGSRFKGDGIQEFQSGAQKIAKANKLGIVPIYIDAKLEKVFEDAPFKEKKIIDVYIGELLKNNEDLEDNFHKLMKKETKESKNV